MVGAGPAGIVAALELADSGLEVLLVESGDQKLQADAQRLVDAELVDGHRHAPLSMTNRRQVGGASVIWGGRCVPYDRVDFDDRPHIPDARWPVTYDEISPYFQRACDWLQCGRAAFETSDFPDLRARRLVPGLPDEGARASALERWSLPTDFGREYAAALRRSRRLRLITGLTCTQVVLVPGGSAVSHLEASTLDHKRILIRANRYVLACGGLDGTRLLLASRSANRAGIGNHSDHLGRWYMGHVEGVVAQVRFTTQPGQTIYGYERDADGTYVRRRFSFSHDFLREHSLPNIVAWLANPPPADASHRSGVLSFAYLALTSPMGRFFSPEAQRQALTGEAVPGAPYGPSRKSPTRLHVRNVMRDIGPAARFVVEFGYKRFLARRRIPGFFVYSTCNTYPLQYHAEHRPHRDSRVSLTDEVDRVGMPRLKIDIRFSPEDVDGVMRAHQHWDDYLRSSGCGQLEYFSEDVEGSVWQQAGGGFHQIGTTRMSARAEDGVVDPNLAVHGLKDLYVVSSSTFPSSSQANSTFMIVAFALRLVDHLKGGLLRGPSNRLEGQRPHSGTDSLAT